MVVLLFRLSFGFSYIFLPFPRMYGRRTLHNRNGF
nr:MAG TPA: hypothetical protein [Caudoviricetes sp.]